MITSLPACLDLLQSKTLQSYPAELSLTAWICFMGTIESAAVTLVVERGSEPWVVGWDMRLFTAVYAVSKSCISHKLRIMAQRIYYIEVVINFFMLLLGDILV